MGRYEALVVAASADEITNRYPELEVVSVDAAPDDISPMRLAELEAQPALSIDPPTGLLAEVLAFRRRQADLTWCSDFAAQLMLFGPASPELAVSSVAIIREHVSVEIEVRGSLLPGPLIWRPSFEGYGDPGGAAIDLAVELMEAVDSGRFTVGSDADNRQILQLPED